VPDAPATLLFVFRTGFNVAALLTIGLALHAGMGVARHPAFERLRVTLVGLAAAVALLAAARLLILTGQMGAGATFIDFTLLPFAWNALGASTAALWAGSIAIGAGALTGSRVALVLGALCVASGFGLTGHTQALTNPGIAPAAVALHVLFAAFWVAAPLTLWPMATILDDELHARLARFSTFAVVAVPALIVVGVWLAWILANGFPGLTGTPYGRLLLVKLGVVLIALALGALNRQVITTRVLQDSARGRRLLRLSLICETFLFAAAILAVSAATTFVGPGE
jgi:copper resistance protein D